MTEEGLTILEIRLIFREVRVKLSHFGGGKD